MKSFDISVSANGKRLKQTNHSNTLSKNGNSIQVNEQINKNIDDDNSILLSFHSLFFINFFFFQFYEARSYWLPHKELAVSILPASIDSNGFSIRSVLIEWNKKEILLQKYRYKFFK